MPQYHILINAQSGTASRVGEQAVADALKNSMIDPLSFSFMDTADFSKRLKDLSEAGEPLLVGGGDGTISYAARECLKAKSAFGILPFGTMNMMARDLEIPIDLNQMFKAYEQSKITAIDVGRVNGKIFLCCAALGVIPQASRLREQTRSEPDFIAMPSLASFVFKELDQSKYQKIKMVLDDRTRYLRTHALVVSNNQYSSSTPIFSDNNFKKQSLHDGTMGIYIASPKSNWQKLRLLLSLGFGSWKNDPSLKEYTARHLKIHTENPVELVSLDGEAEEMKTPLDFEILSDALNVIIPTGLKK